MQRTFYLFAIKLHERKMRERERTSTKHICAKMKNMQCCNFLLLFLTLDESQFKNESVSLPPSHPLPKTFTFTLFISILAFSPSRCLLFTLNQACLFSLSFNFVDTPNCCVVRPAFGCCGHSKNGQNTFWWPFSSLLLILE